MHTEPQVWAASGQQPLERASGSCLRIVVAATGGRIEAFIPTCRREAQFSWSRRAHTGRLTGPPRLRGGPELTRLALHAREGLLFTRLAMRLRLGRAALGQHPAAH